MNPKAKAYHQGLPDFDIPTTFQPPPLHFVTMRILFTLPILIASVAIFLHSGSFAEAQNPAGRKPVQWVNPDLPKARGLTHHVLSSEAMGHDVGYVVWTPSDFDSTGSTRYPVIYFLHGAGGSESSDARGFSSMVSGAIRKGLIPNSICVFPNGGLSGYRGDVEEMIVNELVPRIDADYPTKAETSSRVIAGFSMGGAGSVRLSILHPELFAAAGSWGGALSFRGDPSESPLLPAIQDNAPALRRNQFSFLLINGDQDRPNAFRLLTDALAELEIEHKTVTLPDTKHNLGKYHQASGKTMLQFLGSKLQH